MMRTWATVILMLATGCDGLVGGGPGDPDEVLSPSSDELRVSTTALDFGEVDVGGTSAALNVTVTNTRRRRSVRLSRVEVTGAFALASAQGSIEIPPQQSTTLKVTFSPTSEGPASGELRFVVSRTQQVVSLVGIGLALNPEPDGDPSEPPGDPSDPPGDPAPPVTPSQPGDFLTSVTLENRSAVAFRDRVLTFGQVFRPGEIPPGSSLSGSITGQVVPVQIDAKATHPDGSLRHGVVSVFVPTLAAGAKANLKLYNAAAPLAGSVLSVPGALGSSFDVVVSLVMGGVTYTASLRQALALGSSPWLQGPLTSEIGVTAPLTNLLRATFNVRVHQDGAIRTDVIVRNDLGYTVGVRTVTYDVTVKQAGVVVFSKTGQRHNSFANWRKTFYYGATAPQVAVRRDLVHWLKTKAIPSYDPSVRVTEDVLAGTYSDFLASDHEPMGSSLILRAMPTVGGRPDIGPETTWTALYVLSQDPRAEEVVVGLADAGGSIPWHYIDPQTGRPVTRDDHPEFWLDSRCDWDASHDCPVEPWDVGDTEWDPDTAHMPSLSYVPYMITGDRYFLGELQTQAAAAINLGWPGWYTAPDGATYWNTGEGEVRAGAWSLRTVGNAAYITPDDDPMKAYFLRIVDNELTYGFQRSSAETAAQGELAGYIDGYNIGSMGAFAPWQDDYYTMVLGSLFQRGFTKAKAWLDWKENFTAGRFLQPSSSYCANSGGPAYYLTVIDSGDRRIGTWAGVYAATYGAGSACPSEMDGWPEWAGGFVALAHGANATLAAMGKTRAQEAVALIKSRSTLWQATNTSRGFPSDPTFALSPVSVDALEDSPEPTN